VFVTYRNKILGWAGLTQIWLNYAELTTYPQCSYSSCQSNNSANLDAVNTFRLSMINLIDSFEVINCYVNYQNHSQVLSQVNYSYSDAFNSIFWPIVGIIFFFFAFVFYRCRGTICKAKQNPRERVYDSASYVSNPPDYSMYGGGVTFVAADGYVASVPQVVAAGQEKNPANLGAEMEFTVQGSSPYPLTAPPDYNAVPPNEYMTPTVASSVAVNQEQSGEDIGAVGGTTSVDYFSPPPDTKMKY